MSNLKQKLLFAGLSAAVLLGAFAPLTAMAVQKPSVRAQAAASGTAQAKADARKQAVQVRAQAPFGSGLGTAAGQTEQVQSESQESEDDAARQAQLAAQAKITEAEAIAAVQAANPGSTVTVKELDGENSQVIYDLKVQPADGSQAFEAAVDAVTGELLAAESDD